jgi:hypothetical protein
MGLQGAYVDRRCNYILDLKGTVVFQDEPGGHYLSGFLLGLSFRRVINFKPVKKFNCFLLLLRIVDLKNRILS